MPRQDNPNLRKALEGDSSVLYHTGHQLAVKAAAQFADVHTSSQSDKNLKFNDYTSHSFESRNEPKG